MKKAYLVAVPKVTDKDMFAKEYASKVADTLKPFDGKFLVRTPEKLVKEGEETTLTVVIEFPNKDAISKVKVLGKAKKKLPLLLGEL